jgi:hypothetical protein
MTGETKPATVVEKSVIDENKVIWINFKVDMSLTDFHSAMEEIAAIAQPQSGEVSMVAQQLDTEEWTYSYVYSHNDSTTELFFEDLDYSFIVSADQTCITGRYVGTARNFTYGNTRAIGMTRI